MFLAFVTQVLIPAPLRERPDRNQLPLPARLLPDMNPIEQAWPKLKAHLRAIPDALSTITPSNAQGWFRHAGYAPN